MADRCRQRPINRSDLCTSNLNWFGFGVPKFDPGFPARIRSTGTKGWMIIEGASATIALWHLWLLQIEAILACLAHCRATAQYAGSKLRIEGTDISKSRKIWRWSLYNHGKGPTRERCAVPDDMRFLLPLQPPQAQEKLNGLKEQETLHSIRSA